MKAATKAKAVDDASDDPLESVESVEGALGTEEIYFVTNAQCSSPVPPPFLTEFTTPHRQATLELVNLPVKGPL